MHIFSVCVCCAVILLHVCSVNGKNVLSGKNENFVSCILKFVSYRENVLEALVLDMVINSLSTYHTVISPSTFATTVIAVSLLWYH